MFLFLGLLILYIHTSIQAMSKKCFFFKSMSKIFFYSVHVQNIFLFRNQVMSKIFFYLGHVQNIFLFRPCPKYFSIQAMSKIFFYSVSVSLKALFQTQLYFSICNCFKSSNQIHSNFQIMYVCICN